MGCYYSRLEREEMVSRCKGRKRYMKQFVKARNDFSVSHTMYLLSLRNTGAALLQFAAVESPLLVHFVSSSSLPPPPPPPPSSTWDFWDPFMPRLSAADHKWEEMPVLVSSKSKDLLEIVKELDDYFLRAADSGGKLSAFLEVSTPDQTSSGKMNGYGKSLNPFLCSWKSSQRFMKFGCDGTTVDGSPIPGSHCSTVERLYEWEKKLYEEVKNAESLKIVHEKKTEQLRKLELKKGDYTKTEKVKKEVDKLESKMTVSAQAIESASQEIIKLRESELYPQLVELVKGLMCMWRSFYESHQVQMHIVQQVKYINTTGLSTEATTDIHLQSTLQLEIEVQQWHLAFCNLMRSHREYVQSLTGWLRLSLFQFSKTPSSENKQDSAIYTLCEEWQLAVDNAPDKVASEGIQSLLTVVHAIAVQQGDEQKQKRRSDSFFKELEKKMMDIQALESKYSGQESKKAEWVVEKRVKVEALRVKAEEEKSKYEESIGVTRAMTLNNLQMGLPHVFQAVTGFANVLTHGFESVCNQAKILEEVHDVKRLMN